MIVRKEFSIPSSADGHAIYCCIWMEEGFQKYKGILQISHGMEEHILRYEGFASFLAQQGFLICGNDHAGHGQSVEKEEDSGFFGEEEDSWRFLLADMHGLMKFVKERFPSLPYFLLGHSMGSFLAREFAAEYGEELVGAIFMGTSGGNAFLDTGILLSEEGIRLKGVRGRGYSVHRLAFGAFNLKFMPKRTDYDWISSDPEVVDRFIEDEKCGNVFTYAGFRDLLRLLKEISSLEWAQRMDKALPILLLSGEDDPVGDYGKGVEKVFSWLQEAGCEKVQRKIYAGGRHELLNETFYYQVYRFILRWLYEVLEDRKSAEHP